MIPCSKNDTVIQVVCRNSLGRVSHNVDESPGKDTRGDQFFRHFLSRPPFLERCEATSGEVGGVSSSLCDAMLSVPSFENRMLDMDGLTSLVLSESVTSVLTRDRTLYRASD